MVPNTTDSSDAASTITAPRPNLAGPTAHIASTSHNNVYVVSAAVSSIRVTCSKAVQNTPIDLASSKGVHWDRFGSARRTSSPYSFGSSSASASMRISFVTTRVTTVEPGTRTKFVTITDSKPTPSTPLATITLVKTALPAPTTVLLTLTPTELFQPTKSSASLATSSSAVKEGPSSNAHPNHLSISHHESFTVSSVSGDGQAQTSTSPSTATVQAAQPTDEVPLASQESNIGQRHPESNQPRTAVILASTICGAVALGLIGLLLYCCFKRRGKHCRRRASKSSSSSNNRNSHRGWPSPHAGNGTPSGRTYDAPGIASTSITSLITSNERSRLSATVPPVPTRRAYRSKPDLFESNVAAATVATSPPRPRRPTTSTIQRTFQGLLLTPPPVFRDAQHQAHPAKPQLHVDMQSSVPGTAVTAPFVVPAGRRSLLPAPLRSSNRLSDFRFSLSPNPILKPPPQPPSRPSAAVVRALGNPSPKFASPGVSHNANMGGTGYLALPTSSPARTVSRKSNASSYISWATSRRVSVDSTGRKRRSDPFDLEQGLKWQEPYSTGPCNYQYQYPFR